MRLEGGDLAVELADRGRDERLACQVAGVADQEARREIVRAVGDDVVSGDEVERVRVIEPRLVRADHDVRVEPANRLCRTVRLRPADAIRAMDYLALQVRKPDRIVVDDAEMAYARRCEIEEHGRSETAGAHHQNAGRLELRLAGAPHFLQKDVARIALEFERRKRHRT